MLLDVPLVLGLRQVAPLPLLQLQLPLLLLHQQPGMLGALLLVAISPSHAHLRCFLPRDTTLTRARGMRCDGGQVSCRTCYNAFVDVTYADTDGHEHQATLEVRASIQHEWECSHG